MLALDAGRAGAFLLLAGLVHGEYPQRSRPGRLIQVRGHEAPDLAHRRQGVPGRMAEQPLRLIRGAVTGFRRDRPAVLPRQAAHQRPHVPGGLQPGLTASETRRQPRHQLTQLLLGQLSAYHGGSGRLKIVFCHKAMITGRPPSSADRHALTRPKQEHQPPAGIPDVPPGYEVRLPYRGLRASPAISAYVRVSTQMVVKRRMSSSALLGKPHGNPRTARGTLAMRLGGCSPRRQGNHRLVIANHFPRAEPSAQIVTCSSAH